MWILQNPSYDGYVASFKIRSLHDVRDSHVLEHLTFGTSQILWTSEFSTHMLNYIHVHNTAHLRFQSPNTSETDQLQHDRPAVLLPIGILPPPSSHYAFFPAKLKFGVTKMLFPILYFFWVLNAYVRNCVKSWSACITRHSSCWTCYHQICLLDWMLGSNWRSLHIDKQNYCSKPTRKSKLNRKFCCDVIGTSVTHTKTASVV